MTPQLMVLALFEYVVFLLAVSWHDMVQSWVAWKLGDPTARMLGRMSMNPLKHMEPFGMLLWPAVDIFYFQTPFLIGWSAPIPLTSRNFRKPRRDENIVYISGPVAQLAAAIFCLLVLVVLKHLSPAVANSLDIATELALHQFEGTTQSLPRLFPVVLLLFFGILVNLLLFVFNLVPLPLFDGGKILRNYLPYNAQRTYDNLRFYLMLGFFFFGFGLMMRFFLPVLVVFVGLLHAM